MRAHISLLGTERRVICLSIVELCAAFLLILSQYPHGSLWSITLAGPAIGLGVCFAAVNSRSAFRGIETSCGCFGSTAADSQLTPASQAFTLVRAYAILIGFCLIVAVSLEYASKPLMNRNVTIAAGEVLGLATVGMFALVQLGVVVRDSRRPAPIGTPSSVPVRFGKRELG